MNGFDPARILDAHVHFFDPEWPGGLEWPARTSPIFRRSLPQDLMEEAGDMAPGGVIAVECGPRTEDDARLLEVAKGSQFVRGFIANLQPQDDGFAERIARFAEEPKFKGIRLRPIERYDLEDARLHRTLRCLRDHGLVLEAGVKSSGRLGAFAHLARALPDITCVLVHAGHPRIGDGVPDPEWIRGIRTVASCPNTVCKVTPLMAFAEPAPPPADLAFYRPWLDILWDMFGPDRLIYGSNWPPLRLVTSYKDQVALMRTYLESRPEWAETFFRETARRLYGCRQTAE